jgi:hypothetical protein
MAARTALARIVTNRSLQLIKVRHVRVALAGSSLYRTPPRVRLSAPTGFDNSMRILKIKFVC